jgi:molybdopterin molybdotransferase
VSTSVLSYYDAARAVREYAATLRPARTESVNLSDSLRRTLAQPIHADRDQPPFARSTRDGFACRSSDLASPAPLTISGHLRAGEAWSGPPLAPGHAIEIMTGAPVPAGADCVLMVEHASVDASRVTPARSLQPGENIVPTAAEARAGDTLIPAGTRIGPQHIALAAACGYATVSVFAQPRVAILATGDELVPITEQPLSFQIRNSNSYSLAAQITRHGGLPVIHPAVRDSLQASESAIRATLDSDLLILSGGVSMGKYDFVEQALANLGAEFLFTGARIQPGRPVVFGQLPTPSGQPLPFFGLPGNPVSTLVTVTLFAAPLVAALAGAAVLTGAATLGPHFAHARLTQPVESKPNLTRFLPAYLESTIDGATIQPIPWQGSGDQSAAAKTNCFLVVPEGATLAAGDLVTFLQL